MSPSRILFAQYFNPKMLYNLLGYLQRLKFDNFEIVVLTTENGYADLIQSMIKQCGAFFRVQYPLRKVQFVFDSLTSLSKNPSLHPLMQQSFDYIEYNGGLSITNEQQIELQVLRSFLKHSGCIGLTYFANNIHVRNIREQIRLADTEAMKPFSLETKRLISFYLEANKMETLVSDIQLMTFLGAEPAMRQYPPNARGDMVPPMNWTAFHMPEVVSLLQQSELSAFAWLPTAYSQPYGKVLHANPSFD